MQDQLIEFNTAKLAKEKGLCHYFEKIKGTEYISAFYSENGIDYEELEFQQKDCTIEDRYFRPTQSLLQRWLREVHKIYVTLQHWNGVPHTYKYIVNYCNEDKLNQTIFSNHYDTYEEALEQGLLEGLYLIN